MLPKHWWEGTDASGKKRDVTATTLEPPLGRGAYAIKEFVAGRTVVLERVKDYWGKDSTSMSAATISTRCATSISATITVALEAFKGDQVDWRTENAPRTGRRPTISRRCRTSA